MNSKKTILILLCILIGIFVFLGIQGNRTSESEPVAETVTEVTKEPTEVPSKAPIKSPEVTSKPTKEPTKAPKKEKSSKATKAPKVTKTPKVTSAPKEPKVTLKPTNPPKPKKSPKVTSVPKPTTTPKVKEEVIITIECTRILDKKDLWNEGIEEIIPANGVFFKGVLPFDEKMSAYDALKMACKKGNIALDSQYTPLYETYYIKGIGNLYEFDCGGESGWKYSVNGATPGIGCSSYSVEPGDSIVFFYDYQY